MPLPVTSTNYVVNYVADRNEQIKIFENDPLRVNLIDTGVDPVRNMNGGINPTVGYGWDLAEQTLAQTRAAFTAANITLTAREDLVLSSYKSNTMITFIENGVPVMRVATAQDLINAWNQFTITDAQATLLLNNVVTARWEMGLSAALGVHDIPQSTERAALISLLYNTTDGNAASMLGFAPNMFRLLNQTPVDAVAAAQQRAGVWFEIVFGTNADRNNGNQEGLQNRRDAEGNLFGLYSQDGANAGEREPRDDDNGVEALTVLRFLDAQNTQNAFIDYFVNRDIGRADALGRINDFYEAGRQSLIDQFFYQDSNGTIVETPNNISVVVDALGTSGVLALQRYGQNGMEDATADNNLIFTSDGNDTVNAGAGNDTIVWGGGNDILNGDAGNDAFVIGSVTDNVSINGGNGDDTIVFSGDLLGSGRLVPIDAQTIQYTAADGTVRTISLNSVENRAAEDGAAVNLADVLDAGQNGISGVIDFIRGLIETLNDVVRTTIPFGDGAGGPLQKVGPEALFAQNANGDVRVTPEPKSLLPVILFLLGATGDEVVASVPIPFGPPVQITLREALDMVGVPTVNRNVIEFGPGITPDEVTRARDGNDLILTVENDDGSTNTLTVVGVYADGNADEIIGLTFTDGSRLDLSQVPETPPANLIVGTNGNDSISGTSAADVITALGGNDLIRGSLGADEIDGGAGTDTVDYRASTAGVTVNLATGQGNGGLANGDSYTGIERAYGSNSADVLIGNGGNNLFFGYGGNDRIEGQGGNDTLWGLDGNDILLGGDGNDIMRGGAGADTINGGAGIDAADYRDSTGAIRVNLSDGSASGGYAQGDSLTAVERIYGSNFDDVFFGSTANNLFYGYGGNDRAHGGSGNDILNGFDGNDQLHGDSGNDVLTGGNGDDALYGGAGVDHLRGGAGSDYMDGGTGFDYLDYRYAASGATVNLATGAVSGSAAGDRFVNVEGVLGHLTQADNLTGNDANNTLNGYGGNDILSGGGGNDTLAGGDGNDTLLGGDGVDYLRGGAGSDTMDGGAGFDYLDYRYADSGAVVNLATGAVGGSAAGDNFTNVEGILGHRTLGDNLTGNNANNNLFGYGGNDVLIGGGGNDLLRGGTGADVMNGGSGVDIADYRGSSAGVTVNLASQTATGGEATGDTLISIERAFGSQFADRLTGDDGANLFYGYGGNDIIDGGGGADFIRGGAGNDRISILDADTVYGEAGNDVFILSFSFDGARIVDFESNDQIDIRAGGFGINDFGELLSIARQSGSDVLLDFNLGTLRLQNVNLLDLEADDFIYSPERDPRDPREPFDIEDFPLFGESLGGDDYDVGLLI